VRFTEEDLQTLTDLVAETWLAVADRDWSAPAGTLTWSCTTTADHAVDTVLAPAFLLASRKQDAYPAFPPTTLGPRPTPSTIVDGLETATRVLLAVVAATPPGVRSIIWRRPAPEVREAGDFVPRAGLELILHAHDVGAGLGAPFVPPPDLCERLRRHTAEWPMWSSPGWRRLEPSGDPWAALLRASGRG
jgi:hypothetical protein